MESKYIKEQNSLTLVFCPEEWNNKILKSCSKNNFRSKCHLNAILENKKNPVLNCLPFSHSSHSLQTTPHVDQQNTVANNSSHAPASNGHSKGNNQRNSAMMAPPQSHNQQNYNHSPQQQAPPSATIFHDIEAILQRSDQQQQQLRCGAESGNLPFDGYQLNQLKQIPTIPHLGGGGVVPSNNGSTPAVIKNGKKRKTEN